MKRLQNQKKCKHIILSSSIGYKPSGIFFISCSGLKVFKIDIIFNGLFKNINLTTIILNNNNPFRKKIMRTTHDFINLKIKGIRLKSLQTRKKTFFSEKGQLT